MVTQRRVKCKHKIKFCADVQLLEWRDQVAKACALLAPINQHLSKLFPRFKARVCGAAVFGVVG